MLNTVVGFIAASFLQPYPAVHPLFRYSTHQGVRTLFEPAIDIERQFVNRTVSPIWALTWIVGRWANALPDAAREEFLGLRLADLADGAAGHVNASYVCALPEDSNMELASATILVGRRKAASANGLDNEPWRPDEFAG